MTNNIDSIYDKRSHNFVQKGKTMFIRVYRGVVVAAAAVLFTACATTGQPVYNVSQSPVVASKARTTDDVGKAIVRAGVGLGWQMVADRPGHMVGTLKARTHVAVVDIDYNPKFYSIKYRESSNLNYDGANIHRNYNNWIQNLDRQIQVQLSTL